MALLSEHNNKPRNKRFFSSLFKLVQLLKSGSLRCAAGWNPPGCGSSAWRLGDWGWSLLAVRSSPPAVGLPDTCASSRVPARSVRERRACWPVSERRESVPPCEQGGSSPGFSLVVWAQVLCLCALEEACARLLVSRTGSSVALQS